MRTSLRDLDALGQRPQVLAAIAATIDPDPLAGGPGKFWTMAGVIACWPALSAISCASSASAWA